MIYLDIQNNSAVKRIYNSKTLTDLAERVCRGEGLRKEVELSLLFCDDLFIQELNGRYRNKHEPTDVLAFEQEAPLHTDRRLLGDIVISLETVERAARGDRAAMRQEVLLLFCHGLLHLLGYDHHKAADRKQMQEKQARYLEIEFEKVWH